jgi:hypothetical protein
MAMAQHPWSDQSGDEIASATSTPKNASPWYPSNAGTTSDETWLVDARTVARADPFAEGFAAGVDEANRRIDKLIAEVNLAHERNLASTRDMWERNEAQRLSELVSLHIQQNIDRLSEELEDLLAVAVQKSIADATVAAAANHAMTLIKSVSARRIIVRSETPMSRYVVDELRARNVDAHIVPTEDISSAVTAGETSIVIDLEQFNPFISDDHNG